MLFKYDMAKMILHDFLEEIGQLLNSPLRKIKISGNMFTNLQNQWSILHHVITGTGGVANIKDPHRRPYADLVKL